MSKLFAEEQTVLDTLLAEWYEEIKSFTEGADAIFSEKGKMYDRTSPVWERIRFPHGFTQELRKKIDRLDQLLEPYDRNEVVRWGEILEELGDILNYARMDGALIAMYLIRQEELAKTPKEEGSGVNQGMLDYLGRAQGALTDRQALALANQGEMPLPDQESFAALGRREHHD